MKKVTRVVLLALMTLIIGSAIANICLDLEDEWAECDECGCRESDYQAIWQDMVDYGC